MNAAVAQSVEHRTENPYVDSSILSRGKPERLSLSGFFLPKSAFCEKSINILFAKKNVPQKIVSNFSGTLQFLLNQKKLFSS